jgi:hypothetical protein
MMAENFILIIIQTAFQSTASHEAGTNYLFFPKATQASIRLSPNSNIYTEVLIIKMIAVITRLTNRHSNGIPWSRRGR